MGQKSKNLMRNGATFRPCSKCQKELPLAEFSSRGAGRPGLLASCRECQRGAARDYHARNRAAVREKSREGAARRRKPKQDYANRVKESRPCMDCGRFFPAVCMDFDHRPGVEKLGTLAAITTDGAHSIEDVRNEIAKCDVVCACCHRLRTRSRPAYRKEAGGPRG